MIPEHHRNLSFLKWIFFLLYIVSKSSASCNRSCRGNRVLYPFGFSKECGIQLNCTNSGEILIGEFIVLNVTTDSIIVEIPPRCNRSIETLAPLFHQSFASYAITTENAILLQNCSTRTPLQNCSIHTNLMETKLELQGCGERLNCYSNLRDGFLSLINMYQTGCYQVFSSFSFSDSIEFDRVRLGWWLEGSCSVTAAGSRCSDHASCEPVTTFDGGSGFRCRCDAGYDGDGFGSGAGCRRASTKCNPSKYLSGDCGGRTRVGVLVGVLIGGVIVGASLMVGLALLCCLIRRRSSSLKSRKSARHLLAEAAGDCSIPFYSYKEIERATSCFAERNRIGTGAYGTVYAGKLHNNDNNEGWVAIKKIRHREADGVEQVMNEIKLLSSVSHPNLVRLLGCCIERGEQILVYEFMPNGTLSEHLQRERGNGLPWSIRLNIATETAQAIAHLHCADNPIYHRDIKSSNILLDYDFKSKVADFGLSRLGMTEISHISTAPQGTPGYLDPQYHQNFHLSDKSDVYSFGVVLVEIITALKAVDFSRPNSEVNLAALAVEKIGKGCVDEIMDPFLDPHTDAWTLSSVHKAAELAFRCLAFHRDMRPSMLEVAAELECIRLSSCGPSEENECLGSSFSSPSFASEKSQSLSVKKVGVDSRRLVVPMKTIMIPLEELEDSSPISVQDPWFSGQSSPSADSLLNNAIN